jgi:predicted DNA-binding transcriptional regulator AlpA
MTPDIGVTERVSDRGETRLTARQVRERFGVVARTLDRWLANEVLAFPRPITINKRRYFVEQEILDWERHRRAAKAQA